MCTGYAAALMLLGGQMKFITIFLSVQDDKECLVPDGGHQELGHVSPIRKVEGDGGAATCGNGQGEPGEPAGQGWERWEDGRAEEGREADPGFQNWPGVMLDQSYTAPVRPALGTAGSSH